MSGHALNKLAQVNLLTAFVMLVTAIIIKNLRNILSADKTKIQKTLLTIINFSEPTTSIKFICANHKKHS